MRRTKNYTAVRPTIGPPASAEGTTRATAAKRGIWDFLTRDRSRGSMHLTNRELAFILRNLATLTQHGVSLPKALGTLAEEHSLKKHRHLMLSIRRHLENGESFSAALARLGTAFDVITVNQIRIAEHSGTLPETLDKVAARCEQSNQLRSEIIRKLSYPVILLAAGSVVITFLLIFVVPVFQETYANAKVPLPWITQLLISVGGIVRSYGLFVVVLAAVAIVTFAQLRKRADFAERVDGAMIHWPIVGHWLRDIAVLHMMEVLGNLMEAGFTLADALGETVDSVHNRAVRKSVRDLQSAVRRGERFSRQLESQGDMFPPIVSQLVIVGEQTGKLAGATSHICAHLQREIQRKTNLFVGALEPVLTIALAGAVALILLSIYLPMFDMINTMTK
jgi:type IV pilus assembly protein PilC